MIRAILRINALSCVIFGSLFVFFTKDVSHFLETQSLENLLPVLGGVLFLFAFHLVIASFKKELIKGEIYYFSFGDFLWVVLSVILLISTTLVTSSKGMVAGILVALMVGSFGLAQLLLAKKIPRNKVSVKQPLKISKEALWLKLSDFANISKHHPMVKKSELLESTNQSGLGAKRQCIFQDDSQVQEEIIDWVEGEAFEVKVLGMNMPIEDLTNRISIQESQLIVTSTFRGKGFFSELLMGFLMRPVMKHKLKEVASGFNS